MLLLWLHLFLSSSTTTTTLYYPPLPTSWQVHTLCTTCLPACCLPAWISRLHRLKLCLLSCLWIFLFSCLFVITGAAVFICSISNHWPHSQFNCNLANLKSCWSAVRKICMLQVFFSSFNKQIVSQIRSLFSKMSKDGLKWLFARCKRSIFL